MAFLRLDSSDEGVSLHNSAGCVVSALERAAKGTGPVIVMVHGFKYDPRRPSCNPHTKLFARSPGPDDGDLVQWPRHLGFAIGDPDEGLALAFGWQARGSIWCAVRSARQAGRQLAQVLRCLHELAPERPIHAIGHSLASEVLFEALEHLPEHTLGRIITLNGASFQSRAAHAMHTTEARGSELFNITSGENDLFDLLFERLVAPENPSDKAMGTGVTMPNALNIRIDCPETLAAFAGLGLPIAAPAARVCHWSTYARPGVLRLYHALLRDPQRLSFDVLAAAVPQDPPRRWTRFLPTFGQALPAPRLPSPAQSI